MAVINKYTQEDQKAAVDLLLLAFSSDPFQRFLMPDPSIYLRNSAIWFNNAASQSISTQTLFGLEDNSGIAIWFPPNYSVQFEALEETYKDIPKQSREDIYRYFNEFENSKPKDVWYLEYLGVDPNNHSQGIGTQLLKKSLNEIDALHDAAYLESSNPRNMSLYERHGFEVVSKFQFGYGPPIHTMYRKAR
tara:strand:+ start:756 stop:1328 length:573 start_codon:yes stop_codon:yes gene_type:complete